MARAAALAQGVVVEVELEVLAAAARAVILGRAPALAAHQPGLLVQAFKAKGAIVTPRTPAPLLVCKMKPDF